MKLSVAYVHSRAARAISDIRLITEKNELNLRFTSLIFAATNEHLHNSGQLSVRIFLETFLEKNETANWVFQ